MEVTQARLNVKEAKEALSAEQRDYYYHSNLLPVSESTHPLYSRRNKGKIVVT